MKNAVIFYPHIGEYGGIERNILALASEVLEQGLNPLLLCFYDKIDMGSHLKGLQVCEIGDSSSPITKASMLAKWVKENQGSFAGDPFYFGGKAGFYPGITAGYPYVLHYTDPPSLLTRQVIDGLKKWLLTIPRQWLSDALVVRGVNRAKVLLTMTQRNADELKGLYHKEFGVIYQGGVPPLEPVSSTGTRCQGKTLRLFSICRLSSSKHLDWILDAARNLKSQEFFSKSYDRLEVVIAGKGPAEEFLESKVVEMGLSDVVSFPGFLDAAAVEQEYREADLFLMPARQGFGLPALEALYRKVPVVMSEESRVSEILRTNPWVAVSDHDSAAFTAKVTQHIARLHQENPSPAALESLPTEKDWAIAIGKSCGWWQ